MSSEHPDRDSLSAYLDETLSIDATQWIEQHLSSCARCRTRLEQERVFLGELDGLRTVRAPSDFTQGVMARVAQYPAFKPGKEVSWRRLAMWGGAGAATLFVLALFVGWLVVADGGAEGVQVPAGASVFTNAVSWTVWLWENTQSRLERVMPQLEAVLGGLYVVVGLVREAGLMVQLALLLITVGLNYALTRMVLNYQRRQ